MKMKIIKRFGYNDKAKALATLHNLRISGKYKCVELKDSGLDLVIYAGK
jgi:hypothetical protein